MNVQLIARPIIAILGFNVAVQAADPVDFNRDIRPILSDKCFFCHGPDPHERKADLRLDTAEGAFADLDGYSAIVAGDPEESELYLRIVDKADPMPPKKSHKKLNADEIALIKQWIKEGAPYSEPWAYVAPKKHPVPAVKNAAWPANWIDNFVLAKLEREGLSPSKDADRVTLIRRVYFDLIGLPPKPEAVDAFVNDTADLNTAWSKVVDKLLTSDHFGERLATYWFDLVRYADTVGYHGDQDHNITPYRDWVIAALNANMRFDQFTREQIAGDLLPNSTTAQKVASGYNRLLQTSHEGGVQIKEYDAIYAADRVRNVSGVWMGATMGCAQCHEHKFDPYTMKDHYAMAAFFADIADRGFTGNALPTVRPPEIMVLTLDQEAAIAALEAKIAQVLPEDVRKKLSDLEAKKSKLASSLRRTKDAKAKASLNLQIQAIDKSIGETASNDDRSKIAQLQREQANIRKQARKTMITVAGEPRTMRILPRGNWQDDSGEIVSPAIPEFMGKIKPTKGDRLNRLDLANWFTDPVNGSGGLTARVMANRFWYLFFGTGITRTLDDFGGQGEPPANPKLLDNLAVAFYADGWDIKSLIRQIVTSRSYRQSSITPKTLRERDPDNQLVARQSRFRLSAEFVRDNALAISGLLATQTASKPVKPYQPVGYYRHLNFPRRTYAADKDANQWQRGVYVHWQRMFLHPMLKAMDAPTREECTPQRPRSNTPTAALVLLNDPTFIEAARVFAAKIIKNGGDQTASRIDYAFRHAVSRTADAEEKKLLTKLIDQTRSDYQAKPESAKELLSVGLSPSASDIDPVELATWTSIARAILNMNETVTRN